MAVEVVGRLVEEAVAHFQAGEEEHCQKVVEVVEGYQSTAQAKR